MNINDLFLNYDTLYIDNKIVDINNCVNYINFKESLIKYVKYDCIKEIIFYNEKNTKTEFVLYYIHGFNDDKKKGKETIIEISKIYKANIYLTRLPDNGIYNKETHNSNFYEYLRDIYDDLLIVKLLGEKIILIGDSTGCSYNILISIFFKNFNINDNIMFSPNIELLGNVAFLTKILNNKFGYYIINSIKEININNIKVSTRIFIPLLNILSYIRKNIKQFNKNSIIFTSEFDPFISNTAIKNFYYQLNVNKKCLYFIKNFNKHSVLKYNNAKFFNIYIQEFYNKNNINELKYIS